MNLSKLFRAGRKVYSCAHCRMLGIKPRFTKRQPKKPLCPNCGDKLGFQYPGKDRK